MSRDLSSWCRTPGLGNLRWDSELLLLWENLCNIIILQFVNYPLGWGGGYGTSLYHKSDPLTHLIVVPYVFSCVYFLVGSGLFH